MATGLRETTRQMTKALRRGGVPLDALTGLQVEEHAGLSTDELIAKFSRVGPAAARGRRRLPALLRRMPLRPKTDVGAGPESWSVGFPFDIVLTRDPWMHRMDIRGATGRTPVLTPDHDGVLVADVVAEWAGRHGRPFRLTLDSPAGGSFEQGSGGPEIRLDAVDFCRILSGRPADVPTRDPLLDVPVPF